MCKAIGDFGPDAVGEALAIGVISRAHFGRDREAGRDRQANRRHAIQIRALAAQDIFIAANGFVTIRNTATEPIYILSHSLLQPDPLPLRERSETWQLVA